MNPNGSHSSKRPSYFSSPENKRPKVNMGGEGRSPGRLQEHRHRLPIYTARKKLLCELRSLSSAIIIGETGSGKTTQVTQYILEAGLHRNHMIACTQPRRVAAITVAQRVSEEKNTQLGELVGYCVRFDDMTSPNTKIKYMTDGMLLREAILDPLLKRYSVVILDEAHERTLHTDVLFGVVKAAQRKRKSTGLFPLKIIIMSATMDVDHFSNYFNQAPVLYIEGRQHPIEVMHAVKSQSDYTFASLVTVFQIHRAAPPGEDILVFLTGQEEIDYVVKSIKAISNDLTEEYPQMVVYPLYAALPPGLQLRVFQATPKGARKVIVATNIAETSVTIRGIKYVVDAGMIKAKSFNPDSCLDMLKVQRISKAQAWQRSGRAGREAPGTCYRLYTQNEYQLMSSNTTPEIQRCNLAGVVLQLLAMGIRDVLEFDFMDKPSDESLQSAVEQLQLLGAIEKGDTLELTPQGKQMAAFPLDPRLSKVLLAAKDYHCLEEILTIVAVLSVDSFLHNPPNKKDEAAAVRKKFQTPEGDQMTLLHIFQAYKAAKCNKQWCLENFINIRNIKLAAEVRSQLREICVRQQLPLQSCGRDNVAIRKCLTVGFFMNTAELQKEGKFMTVGKKIVSIHPSSSLFKCKPGCVLYNELVQTTKCYMRNICVIDSEWLYETAPKYFKKKKTLL